MLPTRDTLQMQVHKQVENKRIQTVTKRELKAILIADKIDFQEESFLETPPKKVFYDIRVNQKDTKMINIHAPNKITLDYMKQN